MPVTPGLNLKDLGAGRLDIVSSTGGAVPIEVQSPIIHANASGAGLATQGWADAVDPSFVAGGALSNDGLITEMSNDGFGLS